MKIPLTAEIKIQDKNGTKQKGNEELLTCGVKLSPRLIEIVQFTVVLTLEPANAI